MPRLLNGKPVIFTGCLWVVSVVNVVLHAGRPGGTLEEKRECSIDVSCPFLGSKRRSLFASFYLLVTTALIPFLAVSFLAAPSLTVDSLTVDSLTVDFPPVSSLPVPFMWPAFLGFRIWNSSQCSGELFAHSSDRGLECESFQYQSLLEDNQPLQSDRGGRFAYPGC